MSPHELERARVRLRENPGLIAAAVTALRASYAEARRQANLATSMTAIPAHLEALALDAAVAADLRKISSYSAPAEQLLAAERLAVHWHARSAEAVAAAEDRAARLRRLADEARMAPMREAARSAWAQQTGAGVLAGLDTFANVSASARQAITGRPWHNETGFIATLDQIEGGIAALKTALGTARRESKRRLDSQQAADVVARLATAA